MDFNETLYTVEEVAEILRVSRPTVYRLIKDGRIPTFRISAGGSLRISSVRLKEFMEVQATFWQSENGARKKR